MEALTAATRTLVATGRWLVPWACALVVSSAFALVADDGLTRALPGVPTATAPAADRLSSDDVCTTNAPMLYVGVNTWIHDPNVPCHEERAMTAKRSFESSGPARSTVGPMTRPDRPAPAGAQWVLLSSTDAAGDPSEVVCLVAKDQVAADALDVSPHDAAAYCSNLAHDAGLP